MRKLTDYILLRAEEACGKTVPASVLAAVQEGRRSGRQESRPHHVRNVVNQALIPVLKRREKVTVARCYWQER